MWPTCIALIATDMRRLSHPCTLLVDRPATHLLPTVIMFAASASLWLSGYIFTNS